MPLSSLKTASTLACVLAAGSAAAQSADASFGVSGFATLAATRSSNPNGEYVIPGQTSGSRDGEFVFDTDSKLGLQFNGRFGKVLSGTLQLVSRYNGEGNSAPQVEWAFVKAQALPQLAVRLGRMGLPAFAVSDFRDVNYSNLWVRPPLDVYGQVTFSHFDGVDLLWQPTVAGTNLTAQVFAGGARSVFQRTDLELDRIVGFNATVEFDNGITLRVGHLQTRLSVKSRSLPPLLAGLRGLEATLPGAAAMAEQIDPTDKDASFSGLGLAYDQGRWLAGLEYTRRSTRSYVSDTTGWYGSAGFRLGKFTPYVVLSALRRDDANVRNLIPVTASPQLEGLRRAVDGLVAGQDIGQTSRSIGVRWDALRNTALKLQFDHIRTDSGTGQFKVAVPGQVDGSNVVTVSLDAVF